MNSAFVVVVGAALLAFLSLGKVSAVAPQNGPALVLLVIAVVLLVGARIRPRAAIEREAAKLGSAAGEAAAERSLRPVG